MTSRSELQINGICLVHWHDDNRISIRCSQVYLNEDDQSLEVQSQSCLLLQIPVLLYGHEVSPSVVHEISYSYSSGAFVSVDIKHQNVENCLFSVTLTMAALLMPERLISETTVESVTQRTWTVFKAMGSPT